jgi:hypothetical protein
MLIQPKRIVLASAATGREAGAPITVLLLSAREGWSILTSEQ